MCVPNISRHFDMYYLYLGFNFWKYNLIIIYLVINNLMDYED